MNHLKCAGSNGSTHILNDGVLCIKSRKGEIMAQFNAMTRGPLRRVELFEKQAAGAEGNVAIGVSGLGCKSGLISGVGNDEFGRVPTLKA